MATALSGPLAWEPPYAMRAAQEMAKRQKKKKKKLRRHTDLKAAETQEVIVATGIDDIHKEQKREHRIKS